MAVCNQNNEQDYDQLAKECKKRRRLFSDDKFNQELQDEIIWLRPQVICEKLNVAPPKMFVAGNGSKFNRDRFDVNQGLLGNCWFVAVLARLAENEEAFNRVFPPGQDFDDDYVGIFRFRFYRFGAWEEIVIDDKLPTWNGRLIYLRNSNAGEHNEFWGPLIEKAYAKFCGSYGSLELGIASDCGIDLTGGICEIINLSDRNFFIGSLPKLEKVDYTVPFQNMIQMYRSGAMMFCNSELEEDVLSSCNLLRYHVYTITNVVKYGTIYLVRVRNPHGTDGKEWTGEWCDSCVNWSKYKLDQERVKKNDGEFYMSIDDFFKYFTEISVVHFGISSLDHSEKQFNSFEDKNLKLFQWKGKWDKKLGTAGGFNHAGKESNGKPMGNPSFEFSVSNPDKECEQFACPVIVSLTQKINDRMDEEIVIGFKMFKWEQVKGQWQGLNFQTGCLRDVTLVIPELGEGKYIVVPATQNKDTEADFLLRVYVKTNWGSRAEKPGHLSLLDRSKEEATSGLAKSKNTFESVSVKLTLRTIIADLPKISHPSQINCILLRVKTSDGKTAATTVPMPYKIQLDYQAIQINFPDRKSKFMFEVNGLVLDKNAPPKQILIGSFEASLDELLEVDHYLYKCGILFITTLVSKIHQ